MWLGRERATRIAALIGQALALILGYLGLFGHPMLLFIAFFVFFAAAGEARISLVEEATRDVKIADAMETRLATIRCGSTTGEAADLPPRHISGGFSPGNRCRGTGWRPLSRRYRGSD